MVVSIYSILMWAAFVTFTLFLAFSRKNPDKNSNQDLYFIDIGIKTFGAVTAMGLAINLFWFGINGEFYPNVDIETLMIISFIGGIALGYYFLNLVFINTLGLGRN